MLDSMIGMAIGILLPIGAAAQIPWLDQPDTRHRLAAGEVVIRTALNADASMGQIDAAVAIHAAPTTIWNVLRDCERAATFIPGLKRCHRVQTAADDSWEIIEHDVKYSWLMPTIHSIFRAEYQPPRRIDFRSIGGDLRDERGSWQLEPTPDPSETVVEYQVYIDPGFWIPQALIRHSLRKDLPAALMALRLRVESLKTEQR
jgi:carbon monoxide dehydrogenase subunit G